MNIVFDHQTFDLQRYGGISRYFCELAGHLASMPSCQVNIVAPLHINEYLRTVQAPVRTVGCFVGQIPRGRRLARVFNSAAAPTLLRRCRPDVVHRTYYAAGYRAIRGAATVITVYDMIHERLGGHLATDPNAMGKRDAIRAADHAICISGSTQRDLIELFDIDPSKTSVVHLGFSLMDSDLALEVSSVGASRERPFVLYVGQRAGYKNFDALMAAYASSARLRDGFDLVCFGGGAFSKAELAAQSAAPLRAGAVRQIGGSDAVLRALYQQAAVMVYPSLYEGFGIPPLEAMSFGCPVVCCPVSSLPEVVGTAAAFFTSGDTDSLVAAIERVVADAAYRAELVRLGTERLALFSWERCAEQTHQVYRGLLS